MYDLKRELSAQQWTLAAKEYNVVKKKHFLLSEKNYSIRNLLWEPWTELIYW